MKEIKWGFIGCGEVTEKKSGPAFNEVAGSKVVAVMSRSEDKARSYAERHHIRKWYTDAQELIDDPDVNAVYNDAALCRTFKHIDTADKRAFACTAHSDYSVYFAVVDFQRNIVERIKLSVGGLKGFGQVFYFNHLFHST